MCGIVGPKKINFATAKKADICLIVEGSYPFIEGGVSTWTHDLIREQHERSFHIFALMPPTEVPQFRYELPENVVGLKTIFLQNLPKGKRIFGSLKNIPKKLEAPLSAYLTGDFHKEFDVFISLFSKHRSILGRKILVESKEAWDVIVNLSQAIQPEGSFLDFFWSIMVMSRAIYSIMLPEIPDARLYHALSTGYSGMLLARAKRERQSPCLLTEHGLYTTERRIELAVSDWFGHPESLNLSFDHRKKTLRDFWLNSFLNSAKLCYAAADEIITLFEGNKEVQILHGAEPKKMLVIPNGIDYETYSQCTRTEETHPPTVALVGRVVPIKDVKTYIRAVLLLKRRLPTVRAFIIGPTDEQPDYYEECRALVEHFKLEEDCFFLGKVKLSDFLPSIDLIILTSVSESQPLVILEGGAAGVPSVATKVGSCPELIEGRQDENPPLGRGGIVVPLSNPRAVADAAFRLLTNPNLYAACSFSLKTRVETFYRKELQHASYRNLYNKYL
jgi:polysaccharide biosynthesis protein PelF